MKISEEVVIIIFIILVIVLVFPIKGCCTTENFYHNNTPYFKGVNYSNINQCGGRLRGVNNTCKRKVGMCGNKCPLQRMVPANF